MMHGPRLILLSGVLASTGAYTYEPPGRDPVSIDNVRNSEEAVRLTADNFDDAVDGKLVFIKMYSPYCPHCREMAGAWNDLARHYAGRDDVLIGSVDCTDSPGGKRLCGRHRVMGLPHVLYGDGNHGGIFLEEYGGDKDFGSLRSWADEKLVPTCNPGRLDACTDEERVLVETFVAMSRSELAAAARALEGEEEDARGRFDESHRAMQRDHDAGLTEKEIKIAKAERSIRLIREVMATKQ